MLKETGIQPNLINQDHSLRHSTIYVDVGIDFTPRWAALLQGTEADFPFEASFANHFFYWKHTINGEVRDRFDCTDPESFRLIPPRDYLKAYHLAKKRGEI